MGDDIVYCQSGKQKVNAIHSTESEVLCLRERVTYLFDDITCCYDIRCDLSLPIVIEQDNAGTIERCTKGAKFRRAEHILVKAH